MFSAAQLISRVRKCVIKLEYNFLFKTSFHCRLSTFNIGHLRRFCILLKCQHRKRKQIRGDEQMKKIICGQQMLIGFYNGGRPPYWILTIVICAITDHIAYGHRMECIVNLKVEDRGRPSFLIGYWICSLCNIYSRNCRKAHIEKSIQVWQFKLRYIGSYWQLKRNQDDNRSPYWISICAIFVKRNVENRSMDQTIQTLWFLL